MKIEFILTYAIVAILITTIAPTTADTTTLEIANLSLDTYNFTYQQLKEMPQTAEYAEIYCYGNLVAAGNWGGIQLSYLLAQTGAISEVNSIQFTASDGYTVTIPVQVAMAQDTIIAYQKDGEPLTGLRLVLPGANGASWIANIISVVMSNMYAYPPAAAGVGLAKDDLLESINSNRQATPTPAFNPNQTESPIKPSLDNSAPNPFAPPANNTQPMQIPQHQAAENQLIRSDIGKITVIAAFFAVGLAIAVILTYKTKTKLKDNPHTRTTAN